MGIPVRTLGELKSWQQLECGKGRGRAGEELRSSTELPDWDLQGRTSKLLRLGAKPEGIEALP